MPNVLANAVNCGNGFEKEFMSLWFALAICSSSILGTRAGKVKCTSSSRSKGNFTVCRVYRVYKVAVLKHSLSEWFPWPHLIADVKCQDEWEQQLFAAIRIPSEFLWFWTWSTSKHNCRMSFFDLAMIGSRQMVLRTPSTSMPVSPRPHGRVSHVDLEAILILLPWSITCSRVGWNLSVSILFQIIYRAGSALQHILVASQAIARRTVRSKRKQFRLRGTFFFQEYCALFDAPTCKYRWTTL